MLFIIITEFNMATISCSLFNNFPFIVIDKFLNTLVWVDNRGQSAIFKSRLVPVSSAVSYIGDLSIFVIFHLKLVSAAIFEGSNVGGKVKCIIKQYLKNNRYLIKIYIYLFLFVFVHSFIHSSIHSFVYLFIYLKIT